MGGSCTSAFVSRPSFANETDNQLTYLERGYKDAKTACSPQCEMDEILVAMDIVGDNLNEKCISGNTGLCCAGGSTVAPADCIFTRTLNCLSSILPSADAVYSLQQLTGDELSF